MAVLGSNSGATELSSQLFAVQWESAPLDKAAGTPDSMLLIGDPTADDPLLPALRSSVRDGIAEVELVSPTDTVKLRAAITRTRGTASSWSARRGRRRVAPETTSWSWRWRARY